MGRNDSSLLHLDFTYAPGAVPAAFPGHPRGSSSVSKGTGSVGHRRQVEMGTEGFTAAWPSLMLARASRCGLVNLWVGKADRRREALGEHRHDPHQALTTTEES